MGSGIATIVAIVVVTGILSLFFFLSSFFIFSKESAILEESSFLLEESSSLISLLKTPIDYNGEKVTLNDFFILYSIDIVTEEAVSEKIHNALVNSYGNCYSFKLEIDGKSLTKSWDNVDSESTEFIQSSISLPEGKFYFRNSYAGCLSDNSLKTCDAICEVGVK